MPGQKTLHELFSTQRNDLSEAEGVLAKAENAEFESTFGSGYRSIVPSTRQSIALPLAVSEASGMSEEVLQNGTGAFSICA
jgi:hypothetical protein